MSRVGGKRAGAGRKKTLKSEVVDNLRSRITDPDYELALQTLRFAMKNRKNIKTAVAAAIFVVEQKIGKAPQPIQHSGMMGVKIVKDNIVD